MTKSPTFSLINRTSYLTALIAVCCVLRLTAQSSMSVIDGSVIDPSKAAIAGARAVATDASGVSTTGATNGMGEFRLAVPPGRYTLTITADGFMDAVSSMDVSPDQERSPVVIELQVSPNRETVTISETAGYQVLETASATKTLALLSNIPQSISIVPAELVKDQMMMSMGDVVRYVPGVTAIQGENNRDQVVIRGNSSSADFFLNGMRDDVQYFRDLYNVERVEALKGPNALIFGRGGGGGVINRVTKQAGFLGSREIEMQGGAFGKKRFAADWERPFGAIAAVRLNGVYENSDSFRKYVDVERYGMNPTLTLVPGPRTRVALSYEYFDDRRTGDRGIPSFGGKPADVPISTYFGDPSNSPVQARVNVGSARVEHQLGGLGIRNSMLLGDYDRAYANYVPGSVNQSKTQVAVSAYRNETGRRNLFNQTDFTYGGATGPLRHGLLWGAEFGRQRTGNFRRTGYFDNSATSTLVSYTNPSTSLPVTFRQSATDADNSIRTNIAAAYFQDQIEITRFLQVLGGVRVDRFGLGLRNRRTGDNLRRVDHLISPRAGIILKPASLVSVYGSYSVSWLPSAGDQFAALTSVTQQMKPEKFTNYELGAKFDVRRSLSLTTAVYRLDRTNTRATDPADPGRILQTGSQRTNGGEFGLNGNITNKWRVAGGYAYQDAHVTRATVSAKAGARVAQAPRHSFSLWNSYELLRRVSAGLGILHRSDMFAGIDNTVTLPGYIRADAALFYSITERVRLQANVENALDLRYYINADGNNNISPGSPRALRLGVIASF